MIKFLEKCSSQKRIQWMDECQGAFDTLKILCISTLILAFADFTKSIKLHIYASAIGLGAVLYKEQGGKDRVIRYTSRALSKSESHYLAHNLELLALKGGVTECLQEYLYGNKFASYSDNNPMTYVLTTTKLDATGYRSIAKLVKLNFTIYYQFGKSNLEVDAMSRIPWN